VTTATANKRKRSPTKAPAPAREHVVNIRLDGEMLRRLGEIAADMQRSKAAVLTRAVREYIEREYAVLEALRESDRDIAEGRTVSNEELKAWLKDRREGKEREPRFGR
jgi:predicted transcriptional regulator